MKSLMIPGAALALVSACAGGGIHHGDTLKPVATPAVTVPCPSDRLTRTRYVKPFYPEDAMLFYVLASRDGYDSIPIQYDVTPSGETANIRFIGPEAFLRHKTRQKLIHAAGEALKKWRFEWTGEPGYAMGCLFTIDFTTERVAEMRQAPEDGAR